MKIESVHLPFQGIENCRDMAGIVNTSGKVIKPGLLYRSANLHHATDQDLYTLEGMNLQNIIDLRTTEEIDAEPDRDLKTWNKYFLPIVYERKVAESQGGQFHLVEEAIGDMGQLMTKIYPLLVMTDHAKQMWKQFFELLLKKPGSYLWHCTQGKDRTGMAAILLLSALGVDEQVIINDYLQTNLYLEKNLEKDEAVAKALLGKEDKKADEDFSALQQARMEYYNSAKDAVAQEYGSWMGYLKEALDLKQEDFDQLIAFYME